MSKFLLDCNVVSSNSSSVKNIGSQMTDFSSTISGYDVSDSEDFNFAGAVKAIANNVEKAAKKIENTSNVMNTVVETHTSIQSKYIFKAGSLSSDVKSSDVKSENPIIYSVKSNDNLSKIARTYNVTVDEIVKENNIKNPNLIYVGDQIVIPNTASGKNISSETNNVNNLNKDKNDRKMTNVNYEVNIPSSVKQAGITRNHTNYVEFYPKWNNTSNQRVIADKWNSSGRTSDRGIATLNDRYLVAVSTKFGQVGDKIDVVLEDGNIIPALIADSKGSDAQYEWGHELGGYGVDVIEWESMGNKDYIDISGWNAKKVSKIVNISND